MSKCFLISVFLLMSNVSSYTQELDLFFTAHLEVVDSLDDQIVTTRGYILENELFYDKPNLIRLQNGEYHQLNFTFTFKKADKIITHNNFREGKYELVVAIDDSNTFMINTVSSTPKGISIYGIAGNENNKWSILTITLLDRKKKVLGAGIFQIVYQSDLTPIHGFTQFMYERTKVENIKISTNNFLDQAHSKLLEAFQKPDASFRIKN